jgi:hypothetical protein
MIITKDDFGPFLLSNNHQKIYVDEKYWHELNKLKWQIDEDGYARTKNKLIHRLIFEKLERISIPPNLIIDHINHIRLDNRIDNLRIVNRSENNHNRKKKENTTSNFIGVNKDFNKWYAKISFGKKRYNIGSFNNEKEAALAYNKKAIELYGDKAKLNIFED